MFGSDIIDAALGLILVFSLFSLLCSAINEWVAGHVLRLRAKTLEDAIKRMLADDAMATDFFGLPLIKSLTQKDEGRPAYLSSGTFVNGILTLVKSEAKKAGLDDAAIKQAGLDADQLRA